jgi:hypothetical protein
MKKMILGLVFMVLAGTIFAADIIPELKDFSVSKTGADVQLTSLFPNTEQARDILTELRQGGRPDLIFVEWTVGPLTKPIPASLVELQKYQARVSLTASAKSYVRGEAYILGYNEDMASKIATEMSASIVFAEIIRNNREVLRLEYSWKNPDGTTGYGVTFFLAVEKASLDQEIVDTAKAVASGSKKDDRQTSSAKPIGKTADAKRISEEVNSTSSDDVVKSVKALMEGDNRIQRYREENRQLLGFEN